MKLRSFEVRGFKNFVQAVKLVDLGQVNVIHGANNVGKSNLLEAMSLYFRLLDIEADGWLPLSRDRRLRDRELEEIGFARAEIFNLEHPQPIEMSATLETDKEELDRAGIKELLPSDTVRVDVQLTWMGTDVSYQVRRFQFADGTDAASVQQSAEKKAFVLRFARFLTTNFFVKTEETYRFALISAPRPPVDDLALALYDAKEASDLEMALRWDRFLKVMTAFDDILGEGSFVVTYDRKASRANLMTARIPLHLLGSGVQQIVSVIGRLLMTHATLVAIEEPEINLRYTLQERLRDVFRSKIVGVPGAPTQLFLTSHSPAFEVGPRFYWMKATPGGPVVEAHRAEDARLATGLPDVVSAPEGSAPLSYLSTEGLVRVPERVRQRLGLPNGGGVLFVERDGAVEMMSNDSFAARFDPDRAGGKADPREDE